MGTVTRPWRFSWPKDREPPHLGDVCLQTVGPSGDPEEVERAFLLVGIEETSSRARPYRLIFERLGWEDALRRIAALDDDRVWTFYNT